MSSAWLVISIGCLVVGTLAYGLAGAKLHDGSRDADGALRSRSWWAGTVLQGVGFLGTFVARRALPVVVVQASSGVGLAITAIIQHLTGVQRLTRRSGIAIGVLVGGLALIAWSIVPGSAVAIRAAHLWLLTGCAVFAAVLAALPLPAWACGAASGLGFSYGAIAARLLMSDTLPALWRFWELPLSAWGAGVLMASGVVLGQYHLTRGLARGQAAPVLGIMYAVESFFPAGVGFWLLAEAPRPGGWIPLMSGLVLTILGVCVLAGRSAA